MLQLEVTGTQLQHCSVANKACCLWMRNEHPCTPSAIWRYWHVTTAMLERSLKCWVNWDMLWPTIKESPSVHSAVSSATNITVATKPRDQRVRNMLSISLLSYKPRICSTKNYMHRWGAWFFVPTRLPLLNFYAKAAFIFNQEFSWGSPNSITARFDY